MAGASISVSANGRTFRVFVNPAHSSLQKIGEAIRFVADNRTRTLYVWNYNAGFHADVSSALNLPHTADSANFLKGSARRNRNGSYAIKDSHFLKSFVGRWNLSDKKFLSRLLSQDWSWVDESIRVTEWLTALKEAVSPYFSHEDFE